MNTLRTPVHHSLLDRPTIGGIPKRVAILNGTLTGCLVQGTRLWWLIGVGVAIHALAYWATKKDPEFLQVATRYWKTCRFYDV